MRRRATVVFLAIVGAAALALAVAAATQRDTGPAPLRATTASYTVDLRLERAPSRAWLVSLAIVDAAGRPVAADGVTVLATMTDMGHLNLPLPAAAQGEGRFRTASTPFSMTGRWELDIAIRADGRTETARFAFTVDS
jgi:nitrogen fixation protein FixH